MCLLGLLSNSIGEQLGLIGNVFSTESGRGQKTIMRVPLLLVRAEWSQVDWEIIKEG